ncbi:MAG: hypothetical protein K0R12_433 [Gammaproteobacteria bacterium]|nr:hypothetical protein [Gammaproteobacteria bacterium]
MMADNRYKAIKDFIRCLVTFSEQFYQSKSENLLAILKEIILIKPIPLGSIICNFLMEAKKYEKVNNNVVNDLEKAINNIMVEVKDVSKAETSILPELSSACVCDISSDTADKKTMNAIITENFLSNSKREGRDNIQKKRVAFVKDMLECNSSYSNLLTKNGMTPIG